MPAVFPRPLLERETAFLDLFLAVDFPGVEALRVQRESVRVKALWSGLGGVVLLEVPDADAPRAEVVQAVPVQTRVRHATPPRDVLLFVEAGLLSSIELVLYGDDDYSELPDVASVAPPLVNQ